MEPDHLRPFFYAFSFSESVKTENSACDYFCEHASQTQARPDGIFVLDQGYCLRKNNNSILRAIAFTHGATIEQAQDSSEVTEDILNNFLFPDRSYRQDYWRSGPISKSDCLAAFLNLVASSCEVARSSNTSGIKL